MKVGKADLPLQPQSGSILQPKVAVAATLGPEATILPTLNGLCQFGSVEDETHCIQHRRNRVAVD